MKKGGRMHWFLGLMISGIAGYVSLQAALILWALCMDRWGGNFGVSVALLALFCAPGGFLSLFLWIRLTGRRYESVVWSIYTYLKFFGLPLLIPIEIMRAVPNGHSFGGWFWIVIALWIVGQFLLGRYWITKYGD